MKINDMVIIVNYTNDSPDVGALIIEREVKNGKTLYTYEFEKDGEIHTQTSELPCNCKVLISTFTFDQTKKLFATMPRAGDIVKEEIEDASKTVGICKPCAKVNNIEESLSVGKLLPFKCACCESLIDPKEDEYFVTKESEITTIYRQPFKKKVDVSGIGSAEIVQITGVSRHTLMHWAKHKPGLFKTLVTGAKVLRDAKKNTSYK